MVIDLDSWEAGYVDGRAGRWLPAGFDQCSYSSGHDVGRAVAAGLLSNAPRLRYGRYSAEQMIRLYRFYRTGDDVPA
jgi:hypothetical protein